jgi:nitronate monooxygenase
MPIRTQLTEMLGIQYPIIQGGMQYVGYAEMASAVSNAGGLGILTGLTQPSPEALREEIARCRTMTDKPFGVNLTILPALIPADYDGYMRVIAEERVAMVEIAGGSPKKYMAMLHEYGVKVLHKSATIRHAFKAQEAGVDLIEVVRLASLQLLLQSVYSPFLCAAVFLGRLRSVDCRWTARR